MSIFQSGLNIILRLPYGIFLATWWLVRNSSKWVFVTLVSSVMDYLIRPLNHLARAVMLSGHALVAYGNGREDLATEMLHFARLRYQIGLTRIITGSAVLGALALGLSMLVLPRYGIYPQWTQSIIDTMPALQLPYQPSHTDDLPFTALQDLDELLTDTQNLQAKFTTMQDRLGAIEERLASEQGAPDLKTLEDRRLGLQEELVERIHTVVREEARKYALGGVPLVDYASAGLGASIWQPTTSPTKCFKPQTSWLPGFLQCRHKPDAILDADTTVSNCWASDIPAQVTIQLARRITLEGFTIDHVDPQVAISIASAPRTIELYGVIGDASASRSFASIEKFVEDGLPRADALIRLATVVFDPNDAEGPVKHYELPGKVIRILKQFPMTMVTVKVLDTHGEAHTCLYRVRVHGKIAGDN